MSDRLQLFVTLTIYSLPGLVAGFTIHELAHAVVTDRLGDRTPRLQGRLTLDPLTQIDPIGFGLLLAIGFGFARPVQYNALRIRSAGQRAFVAFVGPLTNLVIAVVVGAVLRILVSAKPDIVVPDVGAGDFPFIGRGGPGFILYWVLYQTVFVNALLFVFNMIPIPPLDGFSVLRGAVGTRIPAVIDWMERNAQLLALAGLAALFLLPRLGSNQAGNALIDLVDRVVTAVYPGETPPVGGLDTLFNALSGR